MIGKGIRLVKRRMGRLGSAFDVLTAAPVNPAKPGSSVNTLLFSVYTTPGPAGPGRWLQEPRSKEYQVQEAAQGLCTWTWPVGQDGHCCHLTNPSKAQLTVRSLMMAVARVQE